VPATVGLQTGRWVRGYFVSRSCGSPFCTRGKSTRRRGGEGDPIPALSPDLFSSRAIFGHILVVMTSGNLFKTRQFVDLPQSSRLAERRGPTIGSRRSASVWIYPRVYGGRSPARSWCITGQPHPNTKNSGECSKRNRLARPTFATMGDRKASSMCGTRLHPWRTPGPAPSTPQNNLRRRGSTAGRKITPLLACKCWRRSQRHSHRHVSVSAVGAPPTSHHANRIRAHRRRFGIWTR